jgi:hypothetical protein
MAGRSGRTEVLDEDDRFADPATFTKEKAIARLWELAAMPPERTRGSIRGQIEACKLLYELGHEPALAMLSELANIDPCRTKGHRRGQEAAEKVLKRLISSIKVDKSAIQ